MPMWKSITNIQFGVEIIGEGGGNGGSQVTFQFQDNRTCPQTGRWPMCKNPSFSCSTGGTRIESVFRHHREMRNARKQVPTHSAPPPEYKLIKLPMQFRDLQQVVQIRSTGLDAPVMTLIHLLGAYMLGQWWWLTLRPLWWSGKGPPIPRVSHF